MVLYSGGIGVQQMEDKKTGLVLLDITEEVENLLLEQEVRMITFSTCTMILATTLVPRIITLRAEQQPLIKTVFSRIMLH